MIKSRVMSRTAAFVFLIGDKYFGTVIAYVPGQQAENFKFTSALPVQIFRHLSASMKFVIEPPKKPVSVPTPTTAPKPRGAPPSIATALPLALLGHHRP